MKKLLLLLMLSFPFFAVSQVSRFALNCKGDYLCATELTGATVHVMIKDFCDDSKPFKKILEDNWKLSKLVFDYSPAFEDRDNTKKNPCKEGDWYMYLQGGYDAMASGQGQTVYIDISNISIGKNVGAKAADIRSVIELSLLAIPDSSVCLGRRFSQDEDVAKKFLNFSNEYYLKSNIQLLEYKMNNKSELKEKNSCADAKEVLANTLYIPDYVFLKSSKCKSDLEFVDHQKYMEGYLGKYAILTNEEMVALFKAGKPFYYLLFGSSGERKYHYIVEGISGKCMSFSICGGTTIGKEEMKKIYKALSDPKKCE